MLLAEITVRTVHEGWAWFVIVSNAVVGLWALGAHRLPRLRVRALWIAAIVAEVSIFVQALLGVVMVSAQKITAPQLHMLYGFGSLLAVALIYSYAHQQMKDRRYLLYGGGSLFLMGMAIRAMVVH